MSTHFISETRHVHCLVNREPNILQLLGGLLTCSLLFIGPAIVKTQRRNCHLKMNGSDMVWLAFQLELNYP